jgi:predicted dehydrogenase
MPDLQINQALALPERPRPIVAVGAGGIVNDAHQPAYRKAGFETIGIFDLDQARARATAEVFGIAKVFASLEEAVASAPENAVFDVAVPAKAILDILPALPDGAAVLIQKPLGDDWEQAKRIHALTHQKNLTAAVNFQMRYAPYVLAARDLISQGAIGELHDLEIRIKVNTPWHLWSFFETLPRVEILYHSIHYLDLIRSFYGEPRSIYAKTVKHPQMEKLASTRTNVIMDYGDTLRANVTANHGHAYGLEHQESYVAWEGTEGAIKATIGLLLNYPKGEPDTFEYCLLAEGQDPVWESVPVEGSWFPDAFIGSMSSLMRYLEGSSDSLPTTVDDALKTMALVEAAHRSSDAGGVPVLI